MRLAVAFPFCRALDRACVCVAVVLSLFLAGCSQRPLRSGAPDAAGRGLAPLVEANQPKACNGFGEGCVKQIVQPANAKTPVFTPQHFTLAYIEFDDGGEFWSIGNQRADRGTTTKKWPVSQLEAAVAAVHTAKGRAVQQKQELLVLTFVHGWHNNASRDDEEGDQNLRNFKQSLETYAATGPGKLIDGHNRVVVGIFLSWRGSLVKSPFFTIFTYSNRRNTANRVGGVSMTDAVMSLALETNGVPAPYLSNYDCQPADALAPAGAPSRRFIIAGHSFGGRALLRGTAQAMLTLVLERKAAADSCLEEWRARPGHTGMPDPAITLRTPIDLIAILNPADDALNSKSMVEALKRARITTAMTQGKPLIVEVKSDGDELTGPVMSLGQVISGAKFRNRAYDSEKYNDGYKKEGHDASKKTVTFPDVPKFLNACEEGQLGLKAQRFYYDHSAPMIYNMGSHYIVERQDTPSKGECKPSAALFGGDTVFWSERPKERKMKAQPACFEIVPAQTILTLDKGAYRKGLSVDRYDEAIPARAFYPCAPDMLDLGNKATDVTVWNDTPFFIMHAPKDLIYDHFDIFTPGVSEMLVSFL